MQSKICRPLIGRSTVEMRQITMMSERNMTVILGGCDSASIHSKIYSWGHSDGLKSWIFYYFRWTPGPILWLYTKNFHPVHPPLWPALKVSGYAPGTAVKL